MKVNSKKLNSRLSQGREKGQPRPAIVVVDGVIVHRAQSQAEAWGWAIGRGAGEVFVFSKMQPTNHPSNIE